MGLFEKIQHLLQKEKPASPKKKAVAFVDYEYWFYSCKHTLHIAPDPAKWHQEIAEKFDLLDILVFGDFSYREIGTELSKIHTITNSVVSTSQPQVQNKKDMTDFIMLDSIYQTAGNREDVDAFVIFTGDGHFQSVVRYLTQKLGKEVVVYGVLGTVSKRLKAVASDVREIPASEEVVLSRYEIIINNLAYVSEHDILATFHSTAETLSKRYHIPVEEFLAALNDMKNKGLVYSRKRRVDFNRSIPVICANWDALIAAGLWDPKKGVAVPNKI